MAMTVRSSVIVKPFCDFMAGQCTGAWRCTNRYCVTLARRSDGRTVRGYERFGRLHITHQAGLKAWPATL